MKKIGTVFITVVVLAALAAILAACNGEEAEPATAPAPAPATPAPAPEPEPEPAAPAEPFRIGVMESLTGTGETYG
ncbi:MAG: hypothetical protein F4Y46_04080, partial [Chloroflexi bacterium]|nr:hypothetical protein [Chloroflexota bacterium]